MSKHKMAAGLAALLLALSYSDAAAQATIGAFFCGSGSDFQREQICQGDGVLDTLCIVAQNTTCWTPNVVFAIEYPSGMTWLADFDTQPEVLGTTPTGLRMTWSELQPPGTVFICHVLIQWNCENCGPPNNESVRVVPNPDFNFLGSSSCGILPVLVPMEGLQSIVCPTVPVSETTWGAVKALYVRVGA